MIIQRLAHEYLKNLNLNSLKISENTYQPAAPNYLIDWKFNWKGNYREKKITRQVCFL